MNAMLNWLGRNLGRMILYGFILGFLGFCALNMMSRMPDSTARARVARVKADMRILGAAIETYHDRHSLYPATAPFARGMKVSDPAPVKHSLDGLTTWGPDPEIPSPRDPFSPGKSHSYAYHTNGSDWLLISPGPDGVYTYHPELRTHTGLDLRDPARVEMTYDPTNGSFSGGDIFRSSESANAEFEWARRKGAVQ